MASSGCYWGCSPVINVNAAAAVAIKNFNYEKYKFFVIKKKNFFCSKEVNNKELVFFSNF